MRYRSVFAGGRVFASRRLANKPSPQRPERTADEPGNLDPCHQHVVATHPRESDGESSCSMYHAKPQSVPKISR
jgi:hypothetical protein